MPDRNEGLREKLHELARREAEARQAAGQCARAADALLCAAAVRYGSPGPEGWVLALPPVDVADSGRRYAVTARRAPDGGYEICVRRKGE